MPAALFMAVTKTLIKALANENPRVDEVLYKVNNELCRDNESCMFVTLFAGLLNTRTGRIQHGNAGHTLPYHISREGVVGEIQAEEGIALGIADGYEYGMKEMTLEPHGSLFLFTDGMSEAMDESGNEYSCARIKNCLEKLEEYSAENIIGMSIEDVRRFTDKAPQSDDITALAIQYIG